MEDTPKSSPAEEVEDAVEVRGRERGKLRNSDECVINTVRVFGIVNPESVYSTTASPPGTR